MENLCKYKYALIRYTKSPSIAAFMLPQCSGTTYAATCIMLFFVISMKMIFVYL